MGGGEGAVAISGLLAPLMASTQLPSPFPRGSGVAEGVLSFFEIPLRDAIEKLTLRPGIYQSRKIELKFAEESSFELDDWQKLARRPSS